MKLIPIIVIIAQICGAFSTNIPLEGQHGLISKWDFSNSTISPLAEGIDTAIGTVLNAATVAIENVTLWTGGNPATRLNLLAELQTLQLGLQQLIVETTQSFLDGTITTEYRQLLLKIISFLQIHLNTINNLITILIPTMEDSTSTQAITSCLHAVQVIEAAIQQLYALFSL